MALYLGALGCADVLNIPDHPRLVEDGLAPPRAARDPQSSGGEQSAAAPPDAGAATPAGEGEPAVAIDTALPRPANTPSGSTEEPETPDAGAPGGSPAPPDAAPPPVDAAPPAVCAASRVLGPDSRCYATLLTPLTWLDARESCRAIGAGWQLASIRSDEVNQFLTALLGSETWIGASDANVEGTWFWIDDETVFWTGDETGSPVNGAFANWAGTEPNGGEDSDCARLVPDNSGEWADLECEELRSAVCAGPPAE